MAKVQRVFAYNNIYTVMLAMALVVVMASAAYVAFKASMNYDAFFSIASPRSF